MWLDTWVHPRNWGYKWLESPWNQQMIIVKFYVNLLVVTKLAKFKAPPWYPIVPYYQGIFYIQVYIPFPTTHDVELKSAEWSKNIKTKQQNHPKKSCFWFSKDVQLHTIYLLYRSIGKKIGERRPPSVPGPWGPYHPPMAEPPDSGDIQHDSPR